MTRTLGLVLLPLLFVQAALARPIGRLWGGTASFSFNAYDFKEFNREVFFLNARELFGSELSSLDPVSWGSGYGAAARFGVTRRIFIEAGVERLEAKTVGGIFSLDQTVLVELDASVWSGRIGLLYAYPVKWGTHLNLGVMVLPVTLSGKFEISDSVSGGSLTRIKGSAVGVEFVVAEPEFFILSQSLRLTFGYRQLIMGRLTHGDTGEAFPQSVAPRKSGEENLRINYSGVFARFGLTVSFGKGQ